MTITATQQKLNKTNAEPLKERETKAHFLAAKIVAFAALMEGMIGIANFKKTGLICARKTAGGLKILGTRVPVFIADLFGFVRFGRKYSWGVRPFIVASHSYFWNKKDPTNALYNGFSLPISEVLTIPFQKPINFVTNPIENAVVSVAKEIIPSSLMSERTIRAVTNLTKTQLINGLGALSVFTLATRVCKLQIEQPKPSIQVPGLDKLFWIGLTIGFYKILDYAQEWANTPAEDLLPPIECAPSEEPVLQKNELPKPSLTQEVETPKRKTLAEKLQESRAKKVAAG